MSDQSPRPTGQSFRFDAKRWTGTERRVAVASLIFFISLFLPWFGASYGGIVAASVDGLWHGYMYLTLLVSLALIIYLVLMAGMERLPFALPVGHRQALVIATGIDFVLSLLSFVTKPSGTSWQYGAYVGLVAAAIAVSPFVLPWAKTRMAATKSS